jgi:DNA-binding transcriptional MerR regulator
VLLTIGQLADHCGVTIRAIRHYHRVGLLPEPDRDASGYRRYGAKAVVKLIRIKVLAEAGVQLIRIQQSQDADVDEFAAAVSGIDQALERQIAQLEHRRRQLSGLLAGDRLVLPAEVANLLEELRAMGTSERGVELEREGWVLMEALCPELVEGWAEDKRQALSDPETRRLYLAWDQAWDLDPDDPRLEELADSMVAWAASHQGDEQAKQLRSAEKSSLAVVERLLAAESESYSPAWRRLGELTKARRGTIPTTAANQDAGNGTHHHRAAGTHRLAGDDRNG